MRRLFLTLAVSAAILIAGSLVPDRKGPGLPGTPTTAECCDSRA